MLVYVDPLQMKELEERVRKEARMEVLDSFEQWERREHGYEDYEDSDAEEELMHGDHVVVLSAEHPQIYEVSHLVLSSSMCGTWLYDSLTDADAICPVMQPYVPLAIREAQAAAPAAAPAPADATPTPVLVALGM